jgi:hypothetical protein
VEASGNQGHSLLLLIERWSPEAHLQSRGARIHCPFTTGSRQGMVIPASRGRPHHGRIAARRNERPKRLKNGGPSMRVGLAVASYCIEVQKPA